MPKDLHKTKSAILKIRARLKHKKEERGINGLKPYAAIRLRVSSFLDKNGK